jgi:hypothetical protein
MHGMCQKSGFLAALTICVLLHQVYVIGGRSSNSTPNRIFPSLTTSVEVIDVAARMSTHPYAQPAAGATVVRTTHASERTA